MKTSDAGKRFIKGHEGRSLTEYVDESGRRHIGNGHLLRPGERYPDGISEARCEELFTADLRIAEGAVNLQSSRFDLMQQQFDALVDFVYNIGTTRFVNCQVGIELSKGNLDRLPIYFFYWTKGGGVRLKSLLARRHACARLFWFNDYQPGY